MQVPAGGAEAATAPLAWPSVEHSCRSSALTQASLWQEWGDWQGRRTQSSQAQRLGMRIRLPRVEVSPPLPIWRDALPTQPPTVMPTCTCTAPCTGRRGGWRPQGAPPRCAAPADKSNNHRHSRGRAGWAGGGGGEATGQQSLTVAPNAASAEHASHCSETPLTPAPSFTDLEAEVGDGGGVLGGVAVQGRQARRQARHHGHAVAAVAAGIVAAGLQADWVCGEGLAAWSSTHTCPSHASQPVAPGSGRRGCRVRRPAPRRRPQGSLSGERTGRWPPAERVRAGKGWLA